MHKKKRPTKEKKHVEKKGRNGQRRDDARTEQRAENKTNATPATSLHLGGRRGGGARSEGGVGGGEEGGVAELAGGEGGFGEEEGGEDEGGDAEAEVGGPEDGEVGAEAGGGGDDDGFFAVEGVDVEVVDDGEREVVAFVERVGDAAVELAEVREPAEAHPDDEALGFLADDGRNDAREGLVEELVVVEAAVVEDGVLAGLALAVVEVAAPADVASTTGVDAGASADEVGTRLVEAAERLVVGGRGPVEVVGLGELLLAVGAPGDFVLAHREVRILKRDHVVEHRIRLQATGRQDLAAVSFERLTLRKLAFLQIRAHQLLRR
mmetsp:Transcript_18996/g.58528  ORF Transcript_18996/g.58528 Transcript_18996/m.58528 type:complete len:322 (-) Transcript_18996:560-1525(-)